MCANCRLSRRQTRVYFYALLSAVNTLLKNTDSLVVLLCICITRIEWVFDFRDTVKFLNICFQQLYCIRVVDIKRLRLSQVVLYYYCKRVFLSEQRSIWNLIFPSRLFFQTFVPRRGTTTVSRHSIDDLIRGQQIPLPSTSRPLRALLRRAFKQRNRITNLPTFTILFDGSQRDGRRKRFANVPVGTAASGSRRCEFVVGGRDGANHLDDWRNRTRRVRQNDTAML